MGAEFPYKLGAMCYIEVLANGEVRFGKDHEAYKRALAGQSRLYAAWPGQWRSDLFAIDDLTPYARAFGIMHDAERTGLAEHDHDISWSVNDSEPNPRAAYLSIDLRLNCGCKIRDLRTFAAQMRRQRGWDIATSTGWGSSSSEQETTYYLRVRRKSLGASSR